MFKVPQNREVCFWPFVPDLCVRSLVRQLERKGSPLCAQPPHTLQQLRLPRFEEEVCPVRRRACGGRPYVCSQQHREGLSANHLVARDSAQDGLGLLQQEGQGPVLFDFQEGGPPRHRQQFVVAVQTHTAARQRARNGPLGLFWRARMHFFFIK